MTQQDRGLLSLYREIEPLSENGKVMLVRNAANGQVCVRKVLDARNLELYEHLRTAQYEGVPKIYECIRDDRFIIVIEEFVSGETLRSFMEKEGPITEKRARRLVGKICDVLICLHGAPRPIVCRDLKPENIILRGDGQPFIVDFDSGKFVSREETKDTRLLGTMGYAAPEQFGFAASDERTDIYAIGVILNELLTGHIPKEQTATGSLHRVVVRCTNLDPSARPGSIREVKRLLAGNRWYPPGFRTGKIKNMIIACIIYAVIAFVLGYMIRETLQNDYHPATMILFMLVMAFWTVAFCGDYLGIRSKIPFVDEKTDPIAQVFIYFITWLIGLFLPLFLLGFIMTTFFG